MAAQAFDQCNVFSHWLRPCSAIIRELPTLATSRTQNAAWYYHWKFTLFHRKLIFSPKGCIYSSNTFRQFWQSLLHWVILLPRGINGFYLNNIRRWTYCFITVTSQWVRWRLKSPASPLFTQPFIRAQIKENIKALRHWPLCGEFTGDRWIPRTNGQ